MSGFPDVGTLAQIGAQVGDVVELMEPDTFRGEGALYEIKSGPSGLRYAKHKDGGKVYWVSEWAFRIASRASDAKQGSAYNGERLYDVPPPAPATSRAGILNAARDIVTKDRQSSDASPEDNFGNIAALWSAHLDVAISSADVAVMMGLVKIARIKTNPAHADNWIDLAGYAACGGEIAMKGKTE